MPARFRLPTSPPGAAPIWRITKRRGTSSSGPCRKLRPARCKNTRCANRRRRSHRERRRYCRAELRHFPRGRPGNRRIERDRAAFCRNARRGRRQGCGGSAARRASERTRPRHRKPRRPVPAYCAAKAGLIHLTHVLAMELARHRILVNALAPGYVETDFNREFFKTEAGQRLISRIPLKRIAQSEDLDGALLFLASPASAYVTGAVISVDGGHGVAAI